MNKDLIIIKLGGSVITDKTQKKGIFRKRVVERLAREIKAARNKGRFDLILVHGAGSFAHPLAKKYKLAQGYLGSESVKGFALTKIAVIKLNLLIWQALERAGLKSSIVESGAVITANSAKIKKFDTEFIQSLLAKNAIPVLSGDVVLDQKMGFSIVSGDQIASYLAGKFKAKRVVFASDVDGIFDKDPHVYKDAKIIQEINIKNYQNIIKKMKMKNPSDVTGEMKGKILSIKKNLVGIKVLIINGQKQGNVLKSLVNNRSESFGTIVNF